MLLTDRPARVRLAALAGCVALAASMAACGASVTAGDVTVGGTPGAATTAPTAAATSPAAPAACSVPAGAATGAVDGSVQSSGGERTYRLWVPTSSTGTQPLPLIVNYHGTGGDPQSIDDFSSNLSQKANARNYLVVAPQGLKGGSTAIRWAVPGFGREPDDIQFTNDMLDQIATQYCVDPSRIYATGFSSGGAMSTWIACRSASRFAAVVPGGGVNLIDPSCQQGPIPMYAYHGTADDIAFYNGIDGVPSTPNPQTAGTIPFFGSVEQVMDVWAAGNGCQPGRNDQNLAPDAILRTYTGCTAATQVLLAVGAGHTFPGGATRIDGSLGETITSVNMADLMLDWFDTQRKL
jgi:polyhydroxybutyrate depolymerase